MKILPIYAALLGLLYIFLSVRTIRLRRKLHIAFGDGGNKQMLKVIRAHSNFAEYAPLVLILLFFVENNGAPAFLVHSLALSFVVGRFLHAYGVSQVNENFRFRVAGMMTTFASIAVSSFYLIGSIIYSNVSF